MANAKWSSGRRVRVLVVDDDPEYSASVAAFISTEGYHTSRVFNGREALDWITRHGHPDVILLDIHMPVMNGIQFMRAYAGAAPVVVGTGWDDELPFAPFEKLQKPFKPNRLLEVIELALNRSEAGWKRFLPCEHTCVTLEIKNDHLVFTCVIPGCEKSNAVHKDAVDFETVLALTVSIAQEQLEREEVLNLS